MEGRTNHPSTPMHAGGDGSSFDLTTERDRGLIRKATRQWPKRWAGLDPAFKARCKQQLEVAIDEADNVAMSGHEGALAEAAKIRLSVVKTAVLMEGQNQSDEHLFHKTDTDGAEKHKVEVVYVNKPKRTDDDRSVIDAGSVRVIGAKALPSP